MTTGSERVSSTWRRPMRQVGPSSSSMRPKRRGRGLSASRSHPPGQRGHVVQVRVPGSNQVLAGASRPAAAWFPTTPTRGRERLARPLPRDRTGEWPRSWRPDLRQSTRKSARAKVPGHSGDSTPFRPLEQPLQLVFRLLVRLDFEPLTEGPYCRSLYPIPACEAIPFLNLFDGSAARSVAAPTSSDRARRGHGTAEARHPPLELVVCGA